MDNQLRAGVARAVITPPVGAPLTGFAGRPPATDVHDELTATALVLSQGERSVALVACDLLDLPAPQADAARAVAGRLTGIDPAAVLIACSHTHYGPQTRPDEDWVGPPAPSVRPYLDNLTHVLAGVVAAAAQRAVPARLSVGRSSAAIGINRRERTASGAIVLGQNPEGPIDPGVLMLRVDEPDGRPLAAVLNHACHGVSLGEQCTSVTADFPAVARNVVEAETGATALFLQGAAGDINPLLMGWDWSYPDALGVPLGTAAVAAFGEAQPFDAGLGVVGTRLRLPAKLPADVDAARAELDAIENEPAVVDPGIAGEDLWRAHRVAKLHEAIRILAGELPRPTVPAELTAVRLGDGTALVTAPAEMFTELGAQIVASSPFTATLYAGYTNGMIGYVPTRAAYDEGGYEVTHGAEVAPEAGEQLVDESIGVLTRAAAGGRITAAVARDGPLSMRM